MAQFRSARAIGREVGNRKLEGASLNNLSLVYDELGDYKTSLKQYEEVLGIYEDADFPRGMGDTLGNIGGVHLLLGRYREALGYYERALAISEELESKPSMSQDHGNIALCHLGLGEIDQAVEHFNQAITLAQHAGMQQDEAYWLRGKGNGLIQTGHYDQGLELHRAALAIYEDVEAQAEQLEALHDMGQLHLLLGDLDSAERQFRRALELAESIGLARGITQNLLALGELEYRRKRLDEAARLYGQASERAAASGESQYRADALLRLALVQRDLGRVDEARAGLERATGLAREIGARSIEGEALLGLAELDRRGWRLPAALAGFEAAQAVMTRMPDPDLQWRIHHGRALVRKAQGDRAAAIEELQVAIRLIEGVRSRLREERFRAGYVQDKYDVYIELVRLQMELGLKEDAFLTAERLRSRNYAEQLDGRESLSLSDEDRREGTRLRERIRQLQRALASEEARSVPGTRQAAMTALSSELLLAEREYQTFLDDGMASSAGKGMPDSIPDAASIQSRLAHDEALVEYVVGTDILFTFVLRSGAVHASADPIRTADLSARIALLRDLTRRPGSDRWRRPATALSQLLIEPLHRSDWLNGVQRLYLVPHGDLNYLPFAVLAQEGPKGRELLIDLYDVAFLPTAAALLRNSSARSAPRNLLAMAPARSRLRHAPDEARAIDALFRPHSQLLVGDTATESRFKSLAGKYQVLHFATHGFFNKHNPLLSGIELEADDANDGLLHVHEVLDLHLAADLVALSACDTALGSGHFAEVPAGDEFVGMTRAFLAAGSESVMATLWEVDDRSSVQLMKRFYERLNAPGVVRNKADALALAQRELRATGGNEHPYYWAPFMLVGTASSVGGSVTENLGG
jgi:CHAT domain-containing protein/tetratricopeptide (TPR) repeat protein